MNTLRTRKTQLILLAILVIGLPLLVFTVQRVQELRQRAAGGAAASLTMPTSLTGIVQNNISVPITVNTDGVGVRGVDVVIDFDRTRLQVVSITANAQAGTTLKTFAPVTSNGAFDTAKVVTDANTDGRLEFSAVTYDWTAQAPTAAYNGTTQLAMVQVRPLVPGGHSVNFAFTQGSTTDSNIVLDVNPPQDLLTQASQLTNLTLNVSSGPTVTPTHTPTPTTTVVPPTPTSTRTPTPSPTRTPTPTFTPSPTVTPTPPPASTSLSLTVKLHGLGNGGDTPNPNSQGNFNPLRPNRNVSVDLYRATTNTFVTTVTGTINFNQTTGVFTGSVVVPPSVTTDFYNLRVKSDRYLVAQSLGNSLTANQANTIPTVALVTGDSNNDGNLDILDYNILVSCYNTTGTPTATCSDPGLADYFDDGNVNFIDLNLWLREFSRKS